MFTVRSVSQAGAFRDEDVDEMASLLELGLRAGVDWLDVETETLSRKQLKKLRRMADARGATLILGSHHQLGETTSAARAEALLAKCAKRSDGDAVKLVVDAASSDDAASAATSAATRRERRSSSARAETISTPLPPPTASPPLPRSRRTRTLLAAAAPRVALNAVAPMNQCRTWVRPSERVAVAESPSKRQPTPPTPKRSEEKERAQMWWHSSTTT